MKNIHLDNDNDSQVYYLHRMGTDDNPDLQLGLLTTIFTILLLHMSIPFISSVISIMKMLLMVIVSLNGKYSDGYQYTRSCLHLTMFFSETVDLINLVMFVSL